MLNYIYIFNAISDCTVDAPAAADAPAVTCDLKDTKLTLFMLISERALRGGRLRASTGWTWAGASSVTATSSAGDGTARNVKITIRSCKGDRHLPGRYAAV